MGIQIVQKLRRGSRKAIQKPLAEETTDYVATSITCMDFESHFILKHVHAYMNIQVVLSSIITK